MIKDIYTVAELCRHLSQVCESASEIATGIRGAENSGGLADVYEEVFLGDVSNIQMLVLELTRLVREGAGDEEIPGKTPQGQAE